MDIISAIATFLAVIVALFREEIRDFFISPKLYISLYNLKGEYLTQYLSDNITIFQDARYFHLSILNKGNKEAIDSQVLLTKLEEFNSGNQPVSLWEGEIPMNWKDQEVFNSIYRTIYQKEICDLCYITEDKKLHLCTLYSKSNLKTAWNEECNFIIHLYVKYKYKTSKTFKFQIKWNGKWDADEILMTNHLSINKLL